ncbi:DUF2125 domain-containing protein [Sabulicella rubraurantiaca]|uniref:DUF2125 domain-containing protein n=1 Tax=Sabulicella rubraurantiaca TaxID=2811429 RepID=UPI001A96A87D|nr:DUF2125 domain-containing protein [Sabulicella rubraurantiaca]
MSRKWPFLLLLLILLGGGGAFAWQAVLGRMERGVEAWAEARRAEGWRITHGAPLRGPLPWRPEVTLPDLEAASPLGLGVRAERLSVTVLPWEPRTALLSPGGAIALRAGGDWTPLRAADLEGRAALDGSDLLWLGEGVALGTVEARRVALRWRDRQLTATAEGARNGPLQLDLVSALLRSDAPLSSPEAFRTAGGQVQIVRLEARRGEAAIEATGTIALDPGLQPEGRGSLALVNPVEGVRVLRDAGMLPPGAAASLSIVAQIGARTPEGGGAPRLDVPWDLRGGRLSAARFSVATFPAVAWR